jgi:hypothetical protein
LSSNDERVWSPSIQNSSVAISRSGHVVDLQLAIRSRFSHFCQRV